MVSAAGVGTGPFWDAVRAGREVFHPAARFDAAPYGQQLVGEIQGLDPKQYLNKRRLRYVPEAAIYFVIAAKAALQDAGLVIGEGEGDAEVTIADPFETGVVYSGTFPNIDDIGDFHMAFVREGPNHLNPSLFPNILQSAAAGHAAIRIGAMASVFSLPNGFTGTLDAVGLALDLLRDGRARYAVVGGAEELTERIMAGYHTQGVLSMTRGRPYDAGRDGLMLAEGGAAMILETAESAQERGAKPLARIGAYAARFEPDRLSRDPQSGAKTWARTLADAAQDAKFDWVCGAANGFSWWDDNELAALRAVFPDGAPPLSSIKGAMGESLGGTSAWQIAASVLAIRDGAIPPTAGLERPITGAVDFVAGGSRRADVRRVLVSAASPDGHFSALTIEAPEGSGL